MSNLIADIGATNARFQTVVDGVRTGEIWVGQTASYQTAQDMLSDAINALASVNHSDGTDEALFAVAGPVRADGSIAVTNTGLHFNTEDCAQILRSRVRLVNDFFAVASGVPFYTSTVQVGGTDVGTQPSTKAVLGPGSGLGMATLTKASDRGWTVLPGEGGHADMSPTSHLETEVWSILSQDTGQVSWESVLSGTGICNLYRATSLMWGAQPDERSAEEISAAGVSMAEPVCHQTMELFASLLGCCAGNLALTVGAQGGVYIAGGIAPRIVDFLTTSPLRRRFEEKGLMSDYVKGIPIQIVTETEPGLIGAYHCLIGAD
ncbi:MAG: glucokinase [Pseudomonadales bacterium]|nr:glucokinase [Pseudomonadales bacterium]